jgi:hypothetical protein
MINDGLCIQGNSYIMEEDDVDVAAAYENHLYKDKSIW